MNLHTDPTGTVIMTTETFEEYLFTRAGQLAALRTVDDMRIWLADHGEEVPEELHLLSAMILGHAQATMRTLLDLIERERDRG